MTVAAIGASALSSAIDIYNQDKANKQNRAMAEEQMRFQERMSSTAHQREVADLRAAGLNPVLSANAGASSPVGASSTSQAAKVNDLAQTLTSAQQVKKQGELIDGQLQLQKSQEANNIAAARAAKAQEFKTDSERFLNEQKFSEKGKNLQNRISTEEAILRSQREQARYSAKESQFKNKHADKFVPVNTVSESAGKVLAPISSAAKLIP